MLKFNAKNLYFTSDLHFNHKNICKYCNRPYSSVLDMNDGIIRNWNTVINENTDVIVLGDLGFCGYNTLELYMKQLKGNIHLIQGNHDDDKVVKKLLENGIIKSCYKLINVLVEGDEECPDQELTLCHFPMIDWYNKNKGSWMIHGHDHQLTNTPSHSSAHWDVGLDRNGMMPVSFEQLKINITKQHLYENKC